VALHVRGPGARLARKSRPRSGRYPGNPEDKDSSTTRTRSYGCDGTA